MADVESSQPDAEYDPFEAFNRAMGAGQVRTPYPDFAEMRRRGPIVKVDFEQMMAQMAQSGTKTNNIVPPDNLQIYAAVSHDAVSQVLRDGNTFSSSGYAASMGLVMGRTILQMDEPEHTRYRGLIQMAFTFVPFTSFEM